MSAGAVVGAGANALFGVVNNAWADKRAEEDRAENYAYNERSAIEADFRTRALYNDFYSPEALVRQYNQAGLSPSLMFGGTPGQGGMSGAKGSGPAGPQTPFMPLSMIEAVEAANIMAQTEKTKAETENIQEDTNLKAAQEQWQKYQNIDKDIEQEVSTMGLVNDDGTYESLFEAAKRYNTFEEFNDYVKECVERSNSARGKAAISTEKGHKVLRDVYIATKEMETDIAILSSDKTDAEFIKKVLNELESNKYAEENAAAVIAQFKAAAASANLTEEQKNAVNRLIGKMKDGTGKDFVVVLGMILANFFGNSGANANISIPIGHRSNKQEK